MSKEEAVGDHIPIKNLKSGDQVLQFFEVRAKDTRKTRSGQEYLDLVVGDASGTIRGKMWSDAIRKWGQDFNPGDFVKIVARVESFRDTSQLVVEKIRKAEDSEIADKTCLVRTSLEDVDDLFQELKGMAQGLNPQELAQLVMEILDANEEPLKACPAARMIHHAYRGGLVEHTVTMVRKVEAIASLEAKVNRDMAVAGAILHDIGKLKELGSVGQSRTTEGKLLGHLILGVALVWETALRKGFESVPWLVELAHIIASHHGEAQFGSPVRPMTREAMLVHFVDNLDSRLQIMEEALESVDAEGFTAYNRWLEGRVYAGARTSAKEADSVGD